MIMEDSTSHIRELYYFGQIIIGLGLLGAFIFYAQPSNRPSRFKIREADRPQFPNQSKLGDSTVRPKVARLLLSGISITGDPHEVLGVPPDATSKEIERAFKELMKRFHPDKIGPPGSREWQDAQEIAAKFNEARQVLLSRAKSKG
jgi:DnaJ-domain-containing protein 1